MIDPEDNAHGFTANPWSPLGRAEDTDTIDNGMLGGTNGNILVISTYNNSGKFEAYGSRPTARTAAAARR